LSEYEELLQRAIHNGIEVFEDYDFEEESRFKGLYCDGVIALNSELETNTEKACVLAEEIGHHEMTAGDILDQADTSNRKQEKKARLWAYKEMITLDKLLDAKHCGCSNRFEIAEFLAVTEEFLQDAIDSYKSIFGAGCQKGDYLIMFEPFNIFIYNK